MERKKVKPQTTFRQGTGMVIGEWVEARENLERVYEHRRPLAVLPGVCRFLIDREMKVGDMYDRQRKKMARGVFVPAPWKEKRAAWAQGGRYISHVLVPYAASFSVNEYKWFHRRTFKWGMIPSLLVKWSNRVQRGLTIFRGGVRQASSVIKRKRTFKWGMIPSLLVDWSSHVQRGLTNLWGGGRQAPLNGVLNMA